MSTRTRALPTLPPETISHIIKLSLPVKRFGSFRERYRVLRSYSLVDRTWRELAQARLFRHVWLSEERQARGLLASLELTGWGPRVRSIRVNQWDGLEPPEVDISKLSYIDSALLGEVLLGTPEVEALWCSFFFPSTESSVPPECVLPLPQSASLPY